VQLKRQAEQQLQAQREWEGKQEMLEARERMRALDAQRTADKSVQARACTSARRQVTRAAAEHKAREDRAAADAKCLAAEERAELHKEQQQKQREIRLKQLDESNTRRQTIKDHSEQRICDRHEQFILKQEQVERTLLRKQVQAELERRQRCICEAKKEVKRREAAKRAEIELEAKAAYYERKSTEKEDGVRERRLQHDQVRTPAQAQLGAEPSAASLLSTALLQQLSEKQRQNQLKATLARSMVEHARAQDELQRDGLAHKVADRMMRVTLMEEQRQHLTEQMQLIRREMAVQEVKLKVRSQ